MTRVAVSHELLIAGFYRAVAAAEPFAAGLSEAMRCLYLVNAIHREH
ncbi:hypothetical protein [Actinoplanes sp. TFC3]|nr:hypothetical protein [Actinoplanes sp. TFC3]